MLEMLRDHLEDGDAPYFELMHVVEDERVVCRVLHRDVCEKSPVESARGRRRAHVSDWARATTTRAPREKRASAEGGKGAHP